MNEKERKALEEKRDELIEKMNNLANTAETETRAFTKEEQDQFDGMEEEVKSIDGTLKSAESLRALKKVESGDTSESQEEIETRAFANIIRQRNDSNITKTDNGAVIPSTIAKKIIDRVTDISPLFAKSERYNIKGKVQIPYVDTTNDAVTVAYATEFTDLEAKSTKLLTKELSGYLAGVLCKISNSLLNNTDLDLTSFVINKIATNMAIFIDGQILKPDLADSSPYAPTHVTGLHNLAAGQITRAAATNAITMDEIITVKNTLKSAFQQNAFWVMTPATLNAVRHLKDGDNRYYVLDDVTHDFGVTLLGKPVYTTDQMDGLAADKFAIYYGDFGQGLATKLVEDSIQILTEKYAIQHATGIVAWTEFDSLIQNQQAIAALQMKAS